MIHSLQGTFSKFIGVWSDSFASNSLSAVFSYRIFLRWHRRLFTTHRRFAHFTFDISLCTLFEYLRVFAVRVHSSLIRIDSFLPSMDSATPTHYDILNCEPSDSIETIKRCYQTLMLRHHPDKQRQQTNPIASDELQCVQRIDEAWKLLRDPVKRKFYDAEIRQRRFDERPIVHETLRPDEFTFEPNEQLNVRQCRCGGRFVLPDDYATMANNDDDEIFIECDECSLVIQLIVPPKR